jgi:hypothetical protein
LVLSLIPWHSWSNCSFRNAIDLDLPVLYDSPSAARIYLYNHYNTYPLAASKLAFGISSTGVYLSDIVVGDLRLRVGMFPTPDYTRITCSNVLHSVFRSYQWSCSCSCSCSVLKIVGNLFKAAWLKFRTSIHRIQIRFLIKVS